MPPIKSSMMIYLVFFLASAWAANETIDIVATNDTPRINDKMTVIFNIHDPDNIKSQYHSANFDKGSYRYGYQLGSNPNGSFHHEARGPDNVTYGCYGFIDANQIFRITHYISDFKGYRVIDPFRRVVVYLSKPDDETPAIVKEVEWSELFLPHGCKLSEGGIPHNAIMEKDSHGVFQMLGICATCGDVNVNHAVPQYQGHGTSSINQHQNVRGVETSAAPDTRGKRVRGKGRLRKKLLRVNGIPTAPGVENRTPLPVAGVNFQQIDAISQTPVAILPIQSTIPAIITANDVNRNNDIPVLNSLPPIYETTSYKSPETRYPGRRPTQPTLTPLVNINSFGQSTESTFKPSININSFERTDKTPETAIEVESDIGIDIPIPKISFNLNPSINNPLNTGVTRNVPDNTATPKYTGFEGQFVGNNYGDYDIQKSLNSKKFSFNSESSGSTVTPSITNSQPINFGTIDFAQHVNPHSHKIAVETSTELPSVSVTPFNIDSSTRFSSIPETVSTRSNFDLAAGDIEKTKPFNNYPASKTGHIQSNYNAFSINNQNKPTEGYAKPHETRFSSDDGVINPENIPGRRLHDFETSTLDYPGPIESSSHRFNANNFFDTVENTELFTRKPNVNPITTENTQVPFRSSTFKFSSTTTTTSDPFDYQRLNPNRQDVKLFSTDNDNTIIKSPFTTRNYTTGVLPPKPINTINNVQLPNNAAIYFATVPQAANGVHRPANPNDYAAQTLSIAPVITLPCQSGTNGDQSIFNNIDLSALIIINSKSTQTGHGVSLARLSKEQKLDILSQVVKLLELDEPYSSCGSQ